MSANQNGVLQRNGPYCDMSSKSADRVLLFVCGMEHNGVYVSLSVRFS